MRISLSILKDFFPIDFPLNGKEVAELLTAQGLEVENTESWGELDPLIVVGEVVDKRPHPNADRLSLCEVEVGAGARRRVVCGAPNVAVGGRYPLAQIGARLPGGMLLKAAKIRGEASEGMLCSAAELLLPAVSEGLFALSADAPLGQAVSRLPGIQDTVFEVNVTPNRGDCLSHLGIARELYAAFVDLDAERLEAFCRGPHVEASASTNESAVEIRSRVEACPHYLGRVVTGISIKPSPFWLAQRLIACGLRPINGVVDATNYILLEWGHPVHAFDLQGIQGAIDVRYGRAGEKMVLLDGRSLSLSEDDLVVADAEKALALAGIMGGEKSGVCDSTSALFLECAVFDAASVRRTAKRSGLATESSYRFSRGVDQTALRAVMARLTELILSAGGSPLTRLGPVGSSGGPGERALPFPATFSGMARLLGFSFDPKCARQILQRLGFRVEGEGDTIAVCPPSFRSDVAASADVAEEIARIVGYRAIPALLPPFHAVQDENLEADAYSGQAELRSFLAAQGFVQTLHFSFAPATSVDAENPPILENPLSDREAGLRTAIFPQLLNRYEAESPGEKDEVRLFEVGKVFCRKEGGGVREERHLAILWGGTRFHSWQSKEAGGERSVDFFDLKSLSERLLSHLKVPLDRLSYGEIASPLWKVRLHPGQSAALLWDGEAVAWLGAVHPTWLRGRKCRAAPLIAEWNWDAIWKMRSKDTASQALSSFPATQRDLTVVVDSELPYGDVWGLICKSRALSPWPLKIDFVALYEGDPLPPRKKSLSFRLIFQSPERTLTDEEVNAIYFSFIEQLKGEKGILIR